MHKPNLDSNTRADIRLVGMPNILYPFSQHVSASRASMFNHHTAQWIILNDPMFPYTYTGVESEFIQTTFNPSRREEDCEVLAVIPRFRKGFITNFSENCPKTFFPILTHNPDGTRTLDYFTMDSYSAGNGGFGYKRKRVYKNPIQKGDFIAKTETITASPAVQGRAYCMGTELTVAYGSFPECIEDAFVISMSAAKKLETTEVSSLVIECRPERRPLNLYGDAHTYKIVPDIGSYVRDDGVVFAERPTHWTTFIADTDPESLRDVLPHQDHAYYIPAGAKIVDIQFIANVGALTDAYNQARDYLNNEMFCYDGIIDVYNQYKKVPNVKVAPKMQQLVKDFMYRKLIHGRPVQGIDDQTALKAKRGEYIGLNNQTVDFLQIIITYSHIRKVGPGSKLTDRAGGSNICLPSQKWLVNNSSN